MRVGGAWTTYRNRRLKVQEARLAAGTGQPGAAGSISLVPRSGNGQAVNVATGSGAVELLTLQSEGRATVPARDWVNGAHITGGERFDE